MSDKVILFADNVLDFLETRSEFLEKEGYHVLLATSPSEAERLLDNARIHLAILDVRLTNDDDDKDISGLTIASNQAYRNIPKIILTGFGGVNIARSVLKPSSRSAINYVEKSEGPEALIQAVQEGFAEHVKINWDLRIDWKVHDSFSLARFIDPTLEGERLLSRAQELEDLLRRLFFEKDDLRIERLLWQQHGRSALVVFAFKEGARSEAFVVVCGQNNIVSQEAQRFDEYSPKAPGGTGTMLSEKMRAETIHFAANGYTLTGNDLESVQALAELYRYGPEKVFNTSLFVLFEETLKAWHQEKLIQSTGNFPEGTYRYRLQLSDDQRFFEKHAKVIEMQIPALEARIERADNILSVHFKRQSFTYPDPIPHLLQSLRSEQQDLFITVPGTLSGENVLTDANGHSWLTDFAAVGLAPRLWNFVNLESVIRFDWVETKDLQRRYELERCLVFGDFARLDLNELEPVIRKPARAIQVIRKLAARTVGKEDHIYHLGIFFHAAHRLVNFNPNSPLTDPERARLAQILFSMAMLVKKIEESQENTLVSEVPKGGELHILDPVARRIQVGNREIKITSQEFSLFHYLFQNSNRVCTKEELVKNVFKNKYNEDYLHTLIGRIRRAIGDDPENPSFIITEPSVGYRLNKSN